MKITLNITVIFLAWFILEPLAVSLAASPLSDGVGGAVRDGGGGVVTADPLTH